MNSANLNAVCPLCRRHMAQSAAANASKLCDDCKSIIETIRPRAPKTSPLAAASEFKGDLSMELPLEAENHALAVQPAPVGPDPQSPLFGRPLREYEAVAMGGEYNRHDDGLGEWPLVLNDDRSRGRSKILVGLVAAVLLLVAAAALFVGYRYFAARQASAGAAEIRQINRTPPARSGPDKPLQAQNQSANPQSEAGKPATEAVSRPNQTSSQIPNQGTASAAQLPADQPVHAGSPATNDAAGGKFTSFQIASFPNEAGAKEFCDRLIRTGLPAYTVSAEIPGKGKWFRVRAGKFGNPQESQQSAVAWRRLAAAAGINLQLVQCDYER